MCDHGYKIIGQLDSQPSIAVLIRENLTSMPQGFTFGPQFLVLKHKLSLMKTFLFPGKFFESGFKAFSLLLFKKIL